MVFIESELDVAVHLCVVGSQSPVRALYITE